MSDWPSTLLPPLPTITPWSTEAFGTAMHSSSASVPTSQTQSQNVAYFFPFRLDVGATAVKMFVAIGGTQNGNIDLGIYDHEFNAVITLGATAMGAINTMQEGDITDTALGPGSYWMAYSGSGGTGTVLATAPTDEATYSSIPFYTQASAHPLPTGTATPVLTSGTPRIILMGVSFDTLI